MPQKLTIPAARLRCTRAACKPGVPGKLATRQAPAVHASLLDVHGELRRNGRCPHIERSGGIRPTVAGYPAEHKRPATWQTRPFSPSPSPSSLFPPFSFP